MNAEVYPEREVKLIVIHCSAGRCNASRYPDMPEGGFHFYIRHDGRTDQLRGIGRPGLHTAGFDRHSIGICYEGGRDAQGRPADTRTTWQKNSLDDLIGALSACFPGCRVLGHDQLTAGSGLGCPGFDVEQEYGKKKGRDRTG